jgi:eukaryotic-like serine/threonine-protein kinase
LKACPTCFRLFPAEAGFCAQDGTALLPHDQVPCQKDPQDQLLGTQILNRYEVRRIVADGGMGRVYEARDMQLDKRVAIKVLHPEVARDQIALERFKREYEISKDLPHEHIVEVLDFQQTPAGQYVMVMEFLDGEELRALLKRDARVSLGKMARILSHVAIGLDEAHRRQFVHRDLKPDNLFLCDSEPGPIVKLLDFGSVRINKNRQMSKLTSLGTTIGSPFYMSPEQAQGKEDLDHRADVFALAAITYEAVTGEVPFTGSNGPAILLAILTKNPPPISTRAPAGAVPPALDDVIDDALAKNPETRTATIGAFADAFGRALGLTGDHQQWANTPVVELDAKIAEERAKGGSAQVVADPFAADPFASPQRPAAPPFVAPPPPPAAARVAMDDAFAAATMEPAGVPQRPMTLIIVGALIAVAAIAGILVLALRN